MEIKQGLVTSIDFFRKESFLSGKVSLKVAQSINLGLRGHLFAATPAEQQGPY